MGGFKCGQGAHKNDPGGEPPFEYLVSALIPQGRTHLVNQLRQTWVSIQNFYSSHSHTTKNRFLSPAPVSCEPFFMELVQAILESGHR